ncbi:TIM barrel protein [Haematospirillum jordaniae]|uniref:Hydroxypyruvate isomerase n=1 Tax=Haematospirillum jordaniae TaxID=1549855 RepID=A0A143DFB1_9PROT|nr:2-oxo-tetronate isomerase [Haematospirillum jordaniae]AMW34963.1 hydroxypyruvate isomerase [Haematospirillum jordaniae]NKD44314.1 TIM barrel protein [Haematospirillum jordaniae]NKD56694.1 TIM barrel protein [Haematospirillum jordaniae]NKD58752.1 TIM barrel protein [Haematospirillum jordaniae]NKD66079.1 TIM barrel protein [Haematospirillum jordaniae]
MPRFAANLSVLFTEQPFLDRFSAAAQAGFKGCEFAFPYLYPAEEVADKAVAAGMKIVAFNAPPGDWAAGERGLAAVPGRQDDFRSDLELAAHYARHLECSCVHVMAGVVPEEDWEEALDVYMANIDYAASQLEAEGLRCLIEPISRQAVPGYFLSRPDDAAVVLEQTGHRNLYMLYDVYHAQMTQGALTDFIESNMSRIAHIQVAGVPGRNEPDMLGEINFRYMFDLLDGAGYDGWIGCEYKPRGTTLDGLRWASDWLRPQGG